jgi:hypothetical protein
MAILFVNIPAPSDHGVTPNDFYMRITTGSVYMIFGIVYCRLIVLRNEWQKGCCSVATILAVLMGLSGMASEPIRISWKKVTETEVPFAFSVTLPLAFVVCDVAAYIANAVNSLPGTGVVAMPPPVPGPHAVGN